MDSYKTWGAGVMDVFNVASLGHKKRNKHVKANILGSFVIKICTSKLPRSDLLMEDDGQLERVERPVSVCLPLRSCRLNITAKHTHRQRKSRWLVVRNTLILSETTCPMSQSVSDCSSPDTNPL